MSDSDNDFIDDDDELPIKGNGKAMRKAKPRQRAAWESSIQDRENPMMGEDEGLGLIERLAWKAEAKKRERLVHVLWSSVLDECARHARLACTFTVAHGLS